MSAEEILQTSSRCRCCLSETEVVVDIFSFNKDIDVANALQEICSIEVFPGDNLPHVICENCLHVLRICHNFRVMTRQCNKTLFNILSGNITEVREDEPHEEPFTFDNANDVEAENGKECSSLICPYCSRTFTHRRNLQMHKQRHFMVGKYRCPSCGQRFYTKFDLQRHYYTLHTSEKPYKCQDCAKTFPTQPELNRHVNLQHNSVKSFSCSECGMKFKLKSNAKQHIYLVHGKERHHACGVCGKSFAFASKLRLHQRSANCGRSVGISVMEELVNDESEVYKELTYKTI